MALRYLLTCPFCGLIPIIRRSRDIVWELRHDCPLVGFIGVTRLSEDNVYETWNTRRERALSSVTTPD